MSDIAIRFDGLALLATLAASAVAYLVLGLIALILRSRRIAWLASLMATGTVALGGAAFVFLEKHGTAFTGPDWVDLLVVPWALVFLVGCWTLRRARAS